MNGREDLKFQAVSETDPSTDDVFWIAGGGVCGGEEVGVGEVRFR